MHKKLRLSVLPVLYMLVIGGTEQYNNIITTELFWYYFQQNEPAGNVLPLIVRERGQKLYGDYQ